ncbi:MAG: hypothetical protein K9M54_09520 [Kiritimatiellales bacterium]|nr:hypothetical protein [Kiritimatiellales bacterium]
MKKPVEYLVVALCLAVLVITSVYVTLSASTTDGHLGIVEADQVLYMQYARNMAAGHPYVYSPGDAPSTGSTTHLYPFILTGIYMLGANGDAFFTAIFILNSLFFLSIIVCVWLIVLKMCPRMVPSALFLSVISGHTLSAVFGQTDIGLYTFLALAMVASLFYNRYGLVTLFAVLCGLTRPEGFIFSVAFFLCGAGAIMLNRKNSNAQGSSPQGRFFLLAGLAGSTAFALTLYINYRMTGHAQFMSVVNKGYFNVYPFFGALEHTLFDAGAMIKGVFFGLSTESRQFFVFPILGGVLSLCGILLHPRQDKRFQLCEIWLALGTGAIIATVASSQWQGLSNDRYLGWIMPIWMIYMLIGIDELSKRVDAKRFKPVLIGLLCAFQFMSTAYFYAYAYSSGSYLEKDENFCDQIRKTIPTNEQFGSMMGAGEQYYLPEYRLLNLYGITSPEFSQPHFDTHPLCIVDILKHHPNLRFENWLMLSGDREKEKWANPFIGDLKLQDTDSAVTTAHVLCVYGAKWNTLDAGDLPALLQSTLGESALIDRMDVGYQPDEIAHDYSDRLRFKNTLLPLIILTDKLGTNDYSDVGRIVMGSELFSIHHAQADKPLKIVLRTSRKVDGETYFGRQASKINNLEMNDSMELRLFVDGQEVPCPPLDIGREGFSEVALDVPAEFVKTEQPRIEIVGDHISFAYWFYQ